MANWLDLTHMFHGHKSGAEKCGKLGTVRPTVGIETPIFTITCVIVLKVGNYANYDRKQMAEYYRFAKT